MTQDSGPLIGIDLGTTYSVVAVFEAGEPRILCNELGEHLLPSVVGVGEEDTIVVGSAAMAMATTHTERTVRWFKRDMGTDRQYSLGARSFGAVGLSALVLAEAKQIAEQALGVDVHRAVVTVPAYFGELQRRATRDACQAAGLEVRRIINEPTAAAMAYGLHQKDREFRAVVLDLGGGTFDVTLLEVMEGVVEIQASAGNARLGGEDFAHELTLALAEDVRQQHGLTITEGTPAWARLREACEKAKRQLSNRERVSVALPALRVGRAERDIDLTVTRARANEIWRPLVERMRGPVQRVLRDAGAEPPDIDEVLLVGGATRMPCVVEFAAKLFGQLPVRSLPADEAVALGAAVQAALESNAAAVEDLVVTDVAPFSLGVATVTQVGGQMVRGVFNPIIDRGTVLPVSRINTVYTVSDQQTAIEIEVFQGEHSMCERNQRLGAYTVKGIPPAPAGEQEIEVRFSYDMNGILDVDTTIVATNKSVGMTIERSPGVLSRSEVARIKHELRRLKFHPRDALPNVTALNRAEAVFLELIGAERELLGQAMAAFRLALQSQEPRAIAECRDHLARLTSRMSAPAE